MSCRIQWYGVAMFASILCVAGVAGAQSSPVAPRITQSIDESNLVTLKGNVHPKARAEFDQGLVSDSLPLERLLLVLQRSPVQEAALRNLLDQQQDKSSPNYHKWLTPEQFGQQYGPADADMQTVASWLQSHGFTVTSVTKGRTVIEFKGTAGLIREAFHTDIHKYLVNGESHIANSTDPQIPAALAPVVAGISSLHDFFPKPHSFVAKKPTPFVKPAAGQVAHVTFTDGSHGLGPADFATIYNIAPLYSAGKNGSGRTVAVLGVTDIQNADITDFDSIFGLPGGNWSEIHNGPDPGIISSGDQLEATLDNEWAGATGQGAKIVFVISKSTTTFGTDLSAVYVTENNLADVMTVSYGACENTNPNLGVTPAQAQQESAISEQAAAQGITYTASTGDSGAEDCDDPNTETVATMPIAVDIPGATPFNVAVGGTMFEEGSGTYWSADNNGTTLQSVLSYIPENVWNESCTVAQCGSSDANISAGGGGVSQYFGLPSWQSGMGVPNNPQGSAGRGVPDVAFSAAGHDAYAICLQLSCEGTNPEFELVGGTSAPTPSFAGIMSIIDQYTGSRQGQAAYVLYALAKSETFSSCNGSGTPALTAGGDCIFNDTTVGNNAVPGETNYGNSDALYQAKTGWDPASGLGSVNVNNLATKWDTATFNSTTTTLTGLPSSATAGQSITNLQITVTAGSGTPGGDVSIIATPTSGSAVGFAFVTLSGGSATTSISFGTGGTYSVVAHYAGNGTTFAPSDSSPSNITVTGSGGGGGSYNVSANPTTATISTPGNSTSSQVSVAGSGGFTGTVTVSCTVAGAKSGDTKIPTCSFTGGGTNIAASLSTTTTSVAETLNIATTAASFIIPPSNPPPTARHIHVVPGAMAASGTLFIAMIFLLATTTPKQRWSTFATLVLFASLAGLASCGGGGGGGGGGTGTTDPGTTADTYTVTVTATSGSTSHITTFTVTVQ